MEISIVAACVLLVSLFIIVPTFSIIVFIKNKRTLQAIGMVGFILYCICLSVLVFGKLKITENTVCISLIFDAPWFSMDFLWGSFGKSNVIYNLAMLFPVSAFVISQSRKNVLLKTIGLSFLISVLIELLQFVLPVYRTTEIFDIVANVCSGVIGFIFFYPVYLLAKRLNFKK